MYMHKGKYSYLTVEDLPPSFAIVSKTLHGTLHGYTDIPFYSLNDALCKSLAVDSNVGCIYTMDNGLPCYSSAIVKNGSSYFYFDPRSRNESGMLSAYGLASLTCHKTIIDLCLFIKHLAASLNGKGTVPFEKSVIQKADTENTYESDEPDFYGFRDMIEGENTCQLYLASEKASTTLEHVISFGISEASDVIMPTQSSDVDINNADSDLNRIPNEHDEDIDNVLSAMNNSATFVNSLYETIADQNNYIDIVHEESHDDNQQGHHDQDHDSDKSDDDPGHDADNEDSDDENVQLSVLKTSLQTNAKQQRQYVSYSVSLQYQYVP